MIFPVVIYGCESWTMKKAERRRIDAFELWCWRRLLRVPWTARRSNQYILKEISPEYSLGGLMLKLKRRQGSQVSMRVARGSASWLSSHGRGLGPRDAHPVSDAIQPSHPLSSPSPPASPTPQFKSINSSALSLLHSPTLTSIHDHRKNHSLDYRLTKPFSWPAEVKQPTQGEG